MMTKKEKNKSPAYMATFSRIMFSSVSRDIFGHRCDVVVDFVVVAVFGGGNDGGGLMMMAMKILLQLQLFKMSYLERLSLV
jgi:hypothetical protein